MTFNLDLNLFWIQYFQNIAQINQQYMNLLGLPPHPQPAHIAPPMPIPFLPWPQPTQPAANTSTVSKIQAIPQNGGRVPTTKKEKVKIDLDALANALNRKCTPSQLATLLEQFKKHEYCSRAEIIRLVKATGLTHIQVRDWFARMRRNVKAEKKKLEQKEKL